MTLQVGGFVTHPIWGIGKVLEIKHSNNARILFEVAGEKTLKLSAAGLTPTDPPATFQTPAKPSGKKTGVAPVASMEALIAAFSEEFGDFRSAYFAAEERDYKLKARQLVHEKLSRTDIEKALAQEDYGAIAAHALSVVNAKNLVYKSEKIAFKNALSKPASQKPFAHALLRLLHAEDEDFSARFENFGTVLIEIGVPKWTIATYFSFMNDPTKHMFMKPDPTKRIAQACQFDLEYEPRPNANTYGRLLDLTSLLFQKLAPLGPVDMIDIQSFIWLMCSGNRRKS